MDISHLRVTAAVRGADAAEHDLLPGLPRGRPEEDQQGPEECLEVVIPVYVRVFVLDNSTKHLHPHHSVDEEDESDEETDPRESLE